MQVAHACLAIGYHAVIPASWGDELIAARTVERLRDTDSPRVMCSCPHVSKKLCERGEAIAPMLLHFVSPPAAAAQYLRAAYAPTCPHITYAGGCPGASDERIDVWLTADAFMQSFDKQAISIAGQPTEFDSVIPPDRRRHYSDPGGVPSRNVLRHLSTPVELVELNGEDFTIDLAQLLLSGTRTLIDASTQLGCCCSGVVGSRNAEGARARVREHEPPRSPSPVVDHSISIQLDVVAAVVRLNAVSTTNIGSSSDAAIVDALAPETPVLAIQPAPRRRSSPPGLRPVLGTTPLRRAERRQLPRAFVARRRSSPRAGIPQAFMRVSRPSRFTKVSWLWWAAGGILVAAAIALAVRFVF